MCGSGWNASPARRLTSEGVLVLVAQGHRSQLRNREEALARLVELIREATHKPKPRGEGHQAEQGREAPSGSTTRRITAPSNPCGDPGHPTTDGTADVALRSRPRSK